MRRQHTGRPGTPVIPPAIAGAYRAVVAGTWSAEVSLRAPGTTQAWDPDKEQMVAVPRAPYYTGPARVQVLGQAARDVVTADDGVVVANYLVAVPADLDVDPNHLATVVTVDDPTLIGRTLRVREALTGSIRVERHLFCTLTT